MREYFQPKSRLNGSKLCLVAMCCSGNVYGEAIVVDDGLSLPCLCPPNVFSGEKRVVMRRQRVMMRRKRRCIALWQYPDRLPAARINIAKILVSSQSLKEDFGLKKTNN